MSQVDKHHVVRFM